MSKPKHIVILGAGFAGLYAYLEMHKLFHKSGSVRITLVNKKDYFLFTPMIHEVATGNLTPSSIIQPIRTIPQCCLDEFIQGSVQSVNLDTRTVTVKHLPERVSVTHDKTEACEISYDYLVMGLGSVAHYFNVPGAEEFGLILKKMRDAKNIKNRIIRNFERAQYESSEERDALLTFVIVGGGATGIELAGEIADLINNEMSKAFPDVAPQARVLLLHGGHQLVQQVDPWFSEKAKDILEKKGNVEIRFGARVTKVVSQGVYVGDDFIPTHTPIWTSGVKASPIDITSSKSVPVEEHTGRIAVNNFLQIPGYEESFVVGDQASVVDKESGQPYPMRAQFAVREGQNVARNIKRIMKQQPLKEFHWNDQGFIVSLGKGGALAQAKELKFSGPFAWWMYRTIYLFKLIGIRMKLRTALEWTVNLFTSRDISKL